MSLCNPRQDHQDQITITIPIIIGKVHTKLAFEFVSTIIITFFPFLTDHSFGSSSYKSSHHTSYESQTGIKRESDLYDDQADYLSDEYEPNLKRQKIN